MNILEKYGLSASIKSYVKDNSLSNFIIGRVTQQHKESYQVITEKGIKRAIITGNLRFTANSKEELPVVGDWVTLINADDLCLIYNVLPRLSALQRQMVGSKSETQLIAANLDIALIVQAIDQNFNLNRIDRYITICHAGNVTPVVVLNKTDLISKDELDDKIKLVKNRIDTIEILCTSTYRTNGLTALQNILEEGKTYGLVGSSGVGKSSMINELLGEVKLKTNEISEGHGKGKHTTTHRELLLLPSGSILIDTPGMRELGIASGEDGLHLSFDKIDSLAERCQFANCNHESEPNCAVRAAVEDGTLAPSVLINYQKLKRESKRFTMNKMEKRKQSKAQGKMYKQIINAKRKNR